MNMWLASGENELLSTRKQGRLNQSERPCSRENYFSLRVSDQNHSQLFYESQWRSYLYANTQLCIEIL